MKVHVQKRVDSDIVSLYVIDELQNERRFITIGQNGKEFISTVSPRGQKLEPFLEIPLDFFDDLAKALLVYTEENNIKSEKQTFLEGELIATKKHLEDLRKIVTRLFNKK